jgi:hypothetical protein
VTTTVYTSVFREPLPDGTPRGMRMGAAPPSAQVPLVVTETATNGHTASNTFYQTFVATSSVITHVMVGVFKTSDAGWCYVQIQTSGGGTVSPMVEVPASEIDSTSGTDPHHIVVSFASPVAVTAGVTYRLNLMVSSVGASSNNTNPYSGGDFHSPGIQTVHDMVCAINPDRATWGVPALGSVARRWVAPSFGDVQSWTGSYPAQVDVQAIGGSLSLTGHVNVWNGTARGDHQFGTGFAGTGLKAGTASVSTAYPTSARLGMSVTAASSNMMSAESVSLRANTADSFVVAPWTVGGVTPPQHSSGGSQAWVLTYASGAGVAVEAPAEQHETGSGTAAVTASASGAGTAVDLPPGQNETGSSQATVVTSVAGAGAATETAAGQSVAPLTVAVSGAGQATQDTPAPTLTVNVVSATSAELVWA